MKLFNGLPVLFFILCYMKKLYFFRCILTLFILVGYVGYSQSYFKKFASISHIKSVEKGSKNYSFNFNPVLQPKDNIAIEKDLKGKFQTQGTLFLAYESMQEEEINLVELKDSKNTILITNRNIVFSDGYQNNIEPYYGSILSYSFARDNYGRKNNGVFINKEFRSDQNKILEFIYIPNIISTLDREKIETYLSLKYGISLYSSHYISSVNDTVWSPKGNKGFGHRVTGIGRDDNYGLYQRKSGNSVSKDLLIGVDSTAIINNNSFFIWSDNAKSTHLKGNSSKEKISTIDRTWKVNPFGVEKDFGNISIEVDPEILFEAYDYRLEKTDEVLWLIKSTTNDFLSDVEYIKQTRTEKEKVVFEHLDFTDTAYFSFLIAPEFFVNYDITTQLCNGRTDVELMVIGGVPPYTIEIYAENYKSEKQLEGSEYKVSDLPAGEYSVMVQDSYQNTFSFVVDVTQPISTDIVLDPIWVLSDDSEIRILPELSDPDHIAKYEWSKEGNVIADASVLTTNQVGDYTLRVYMNDGCEQLINFKVISQDITSDQITIYPNSSERGHPVYIDFSLEDKKNVEIFIHDMLGKEVMYEKLLDIRDYRYSVILEISGTYLITINSEETSLVKKIVIK